MSFDTCKMRCEQLGQLCQAVEYSVSSQSCKLWGAAKAGDTPQLHGSKTDATNTAICYVRANEVSTGSSPTMILDAPDWARWQVPKDVNSVHVLVVGGGGGGAGLGAGGGGGGVVETHNYKVVPRSSVWLASGAGGTRGSMPGCAFDDLTVAFKSRATGPGCAAGNVVRPSATCSFTRDGYDCETTTCMFDGWSNSNPICASHTGCSHTNLTLPPGVTSNGTTCNIKGMTQSTFSCSFTAIGYHCTDASCYRGVWSTADPCTALGACNMARLTLPPDVTAQGPGCVDGLATQTVPSHTWCSFNKAGWDCGAAKCISGIFNTSSPCVQQQGIYRGRFDISFISLCWQVASLVAKLRLRPRQCPPLHQLPLPPLHQLQLPHQHQLQLPPLHRLAPHQHRLARPMHQLAQHQHRRLRRHLHQRLLV